MQNYLKIILTTGIQASGKSTWARNEYQSNYNSTVLISRDEIRNMIDCGTWSSGKEKFIIKIRNEIILQAIKNNKNIILHDTNLNRKIFNDICKIVEKLNINVIVEEKFFPIELNEAIERDSKRLGNAKVGEIVIKRAWKDWSNIKNTEPRKMIFSEKEPDKIEIDPNLQNIILCDLDGSLAIIGNRSAYDASNCDLTDELNKPLAEILENFHSNNYKIIFMSGRQDKDRIPTQKFLDKHLSFQYDLYMRSTGDMRSDNIVKEELFNKFIKDKYNVLCVFDDRISVCRLWYKLGLNLFRIGDPDADF